MQLEFKVKLTLQKGTEIAKLLALVAPKTRFHIDLKKGYILVSDFSKELSERIIDIVEKTADEIQSIDLNSEKNFKLMKDEKLISQKKEKVLQQLKNTESFSLIVKKSIFERKVFTLTDLREEFPNANFATIRSYVNDLKKDGLIVEISRGKYAVL